MHGNADSGFSYILQFHSIKRIKEYVFPSQPFSFTEFPPIPVLIHQGKDASVSSLCPLDQPLQINSHLVSSPRTKVFSDALQRRGFLTAAFIICVALQNPFQFCNIFFTNTT